MSHQELSDRLAGQILLPLAVGLHEGPLGRSGDQNRTGGQHRPDRPHTFGRSRLAESGSLLRRNLGSGRKMKVAEIH